MTFLESKPLTRYGTAEAQMGLLTEERGCRKCKNEVALPSLVLKGMGSGCYKTAHCDEGTMGRRRPPGFGVR